jgi:hypothetical protein
MHKVADEKNKWNGLNEMWKRIFYQKVVFLTIGTELSEIGTQVQVIMGLCREH